MDKVLERFRAINWNYAPRDDAARQELDSRIADVGRRRGLITYSDLVRGVTFNLSNLREPKHQIDTSAEAEVPNVRKAVLGSPARATGSYWEAQSWAHRAVQNRASRR